MSMSQVNMWHVAMIGPILYHIGNNEKETKSYVYTALATLALSIIFVVRRPTKLSYRGIINAMHYIIYIPLFLYISYKNKELPIWAFRLIKYLGIAVTAIHFYLLYKKNLNK